MTLDDLRFLLTAAGERWLTETAVAPITRHNHLQIAARLRRDLPASQAQAVLETALLRQLATVKFSRAAEMFFTRPALEQASSELISAYRARRFEAAGLQRVADLGCGIGGDALGLTAVSDLVGVDWEPLRLAMAAENMRVYGRDGFHPLQADIAALSPLDAEGYFFDPARRDERGRRFFSVTEYQPSMQVVDRWRGVVGETAVKISPGVDYDELPADAEVEFISVKGELKEAALWFGGLRSGAARRATLLPGEHTMTDAGMPDYIEATTPKTYLYEPDSAIIRAHLVKQLAYRLRATKLDDEIAYLTSDRQLETPFARCFTLHDHFPFQLKRLRTYLRERNIGKVTIKKRGSPLEPDTLRRQLRLRGDNEAIIFLTFVKGETAVLIGEEAKSKWMRDEG